MNFRLCILVLMLAAAVPAGAATVSRSYSYFSVHGRTLGAIERQMEQHGPAIRSTGKRHPGATRMTFTTKLTYGSRSGHCRIADARVSVSAKVILPRWRDRKRSALPVQLIWDALSRDIKRHEESHISIAKNHASEIETTLMALPSASNCQVLAQQASAATARILADHDAAQDRFDRIENINFEDRLLRLLRYRLQNYRASETEAPFAHR